MRGHRRAIRSMIVALVTIGCSDPLAPFEPEISNEVDSFELQATDVAGVTATLDFPWVNTGTSADVDHSTVTNVGRASLLVRDANGSVVYDKILTPSLNEQTLPGIAGTWSVTLVLADFSGTLNFRLQKP